MKSSTPAKIIGLDSFRRNTKSGEDLTTISELALRLQQSIEITPLLNTFCEETAQIIPCDSVAYNNKEFDLSYETGTKNVHHCKYSLELEGESLGDIICTRAKPFTVRETNLIERLLSSLIYPLRNSLLYQQAITQAHRDPLTQISNRAAFDNSLNKQISSFRRHNTDFSLMIIDIDHFKQVNDTYGHIAGDKVLKSVAQTISQTIRCADEVFRYGGEEFVVILSNTKQAGATFIAERVRRQIEKLEVKIKTSISVTASIGIASSDLVNEAKETLDFADKALYKAKNSGRNQICTCP